MNVWWWVSGIWGVWLVLKLHNISTNLHIIIRNQKILDGKLDSIILQEEQ